MPMTAAMSRALDMHLPVPNDFRANAARRSLTDDSLRRKLIAFRELFGKPVPVEFTAPGEDELRLRFNLLDEEVGEAFAATTLHEYIDALGDIIIVAVDGLVAAGLDPALVLQEIHCSNMTKVDPKVGPLLRADGKMLKNLDTFIPPDFSHIVADAPIDNCLAPQEPTS